MVVTSQEQIDELNKYCSGVATGVEGGMTFYALRALRLPPGCTPACCDAVLWPAPRDGYPSRLYFSVQVTGPYTRNWNEDKARILERNWFAFSWKVDQPHATLAGLLIAHLNGFAKEK